MIAWKWQGEPVTVETLDNMPEVLYDFKRSLTSRGFSEEQAFALVIELFRKMVTIEEDKK